MNKRQELATIAAGLVAGVLVLASPSVVFAQANVTCKPTETQAECHARLKCNANEDLEDCQKRLMRCKSGEDVETCQKRRASDGRGSDDRGDDRRGNDDRGGRDDDGRDDDGRDDGDRDRGDRGDRGDGGDRGGRGERGDNGGRRHRRGGGRGGRGFESIKTFGLGLELGEPTGLNGKYFLSEAGAFDFGVGYIYSHYYYGDGIHLYGDYLFHPTSLASNNTFELPLYIGVGLRYWDFDYCVDRVCDYGGSAVGIRVPVGISFDFNTKPIDIFIQLAPVLDFINGDYYDRYRDRTHFGIDFSFGIRFWLK